MIPDSSQRQNPSQQRDPGISTAHAVSPDSGEHWTAEGAWRVADGIFRIPLPLPMDGLRAINVYAIETGDGLTLVDGGWSIPVARDLLDRCLREVGYGFGDIRRFLVTHVHRDHYTMARVLGTELAVEVSLGRDEKPALDLLNNVADLTENPFVAVLVSAGAREVADQWMRMDGDDLPDPAMWGYPDVWLSGDQELRVGTRTIDAVHTPGHTPGHFVYADKAAGLLFAGDHVLPTITPSIGFTVPPTDHPLGDFMASLAKVRDLPDLTVLPAHGPVAPSSHTRVDELLVHHERRLAESAHLLAGRPCTSYEVAQGLGWTRHETPFEKLDVFSQGMASMETKAHLDLLVARGRASRAEHPDGVVYAARS